LKTVTGKLTDAGGNPLPSASVSATLSQQCAITGSSEVAPTEIDGKVAGDGTWSLSLYSTNDLTPNNTYYTIKCYSGGSVVQTWIVQIPQTAGPFEVSTITTSTPTASPTPSHVSTLTVDGAATFTAGPVIIGTDPGGAQLLRVGGTGHFSGAVTLDAGALLAAGQGLDVGSAGALQLGKNTATSILVGAPLSFAANSGGYTVVTGVINDGQEFIFGANPTGANGFVFRPQGTNVSATEVDIKPTGAVVINAGGLTVSAGGIRLTGDPGALAGVLGVTNATGLGNGAQTAVTAPLVGTGTGPATPTAVAQWLKVYDGATTRWIPMMV